MFSHLIFAKTLCGRYSGSYLLNEEFEIRKVVYIRDSKPRFSGNKALVLSKTLMTMHPQVSESVCLYFPLCAVHLNFIIVRHQKSSM